MNGNEQLIADLKAARAELVVRGRCTGTPLGWGGDGVCLIGSAIAAVAPDSLTGDTRTYDVSEQPRSMAVVRTLRRYLPGVVARDSDPNESADTTATFDVAYFNDRSRTTDQDVLDLFDKALADLGGLA